MARLTTRSVDPNNNSLALILRNNIFALVQTLPYFANFKTFVPNKAFPMQVADLPYCGVYLVDEAGSPDGNADAGEPRFMVSVRIGFTVWIADNDRVQSELQLDGAFRAIMRGVLEVPTIYRDPIAPVQGFIRYSRSHHYGTAAFNNETPVAEMRLELTCQYGEDYRYVPVDTFALMHIQTAYPSIADAPNVQQIIADWDIPQ